MKYFKNYLINYYFKSYAKHVNISNIMHYKAI